MIEEVEPSKVGTHECPIPVQDDEEQRQEINNEMERGRRSNIMQEAEMSNHPMDLVFAAVKVSKKMQGKPIKQRDRELHKAINSFFVEKAGIKLSQGHFDTRIEPDYSDEETQPSPCHIMLFGVDLLTTRSLQAYFRSLDVRIQRVKWINESNCILAFGTAQMARAALESHFKNPVVKDVDSDELEREWFSLKPYDFLCFERELLARYATTKEIEEPAEEEPAEGEEPKKKKGRKINKHSKFNDAIAFLPEYLLKTYDATLIYRRAYEQKSKKLEKVKERKVRERERSRERQEQRRLFRLGLDKTEDDGARSVQGSQADGHGKVDYREVLNKMNMSLDEYFGRPVEREEEAEVDKSVIIPGIEPEDYPEGEAAPAAGNEEGVMADVNLSPIADRQEEMAEEGEPVLQEMGESVLPPELKDDAPAEEKKDIEEEVPAE